MTCFRATIHGTPRPQGSYRMIPVNGRVIAKPPNTLVTWRNDVVTELRRIADLEGWDPVEGPAAAHLLFYFPRPGSHSKKRQVADVGSKADGPDLDKLTRAIFDALQAAHIIKDDRQITVLTAAKRYADAEDEHPGVDIALFPIP